MTGAVNVIRPKVARLLVGAITLVLVSCGAEEDKARLTLRKAEQDLTVEDFGKYPVWTWAPRTDAERREESTDIPRLWPVLDPNEIDPSTPHDGSYLVKATFTGADGTVFQGYCAPCRTGDWGTVQPTIITPKGHVGFWAVSQGQSGIPTLEERYRLLGKDKIALFPVRFEALVKVPGKGSSGTLEGFLIPDGDRVKVVQ